MNTTESLEAKIRNLLSPAYNLASMIISEKKYLIMGDPTIESFIINEANQTLESIQEILNLLDDGEEKEG